MPGPGPGQILVKVARCGICGSDLAMTDTLSPVSFDSGCVPGHEFSGEVVALGTDVEHFALSDRVTQQRHA